jgi:hypothetical protein
MAIRTTPAPLAVARAIENPTSAPPNEPRDVAPNAAPNADCKVWQHGAGRARLRLLSPSSGAPPASPQEVLARSAPAQLRKLVNDTKASAPQLNADVAALEARVATAKSRYDNAAAAVSTIDHLKLGTPASIKARDDAKAELAGLEAQLKSKREEGPKAAGEMKKQLAAYLHEASPQFREIEQKRDVLEQAVNSLQEVNRQIGYRRTNGVHKDDPIEELTALTTKYNASIDALAAGTSGVVGDGDKLPAGPKSPALLDSVAGLTLGDLRTRLSQQTRGLDNSVYALEMMLTK